MAKQKFMDWEEYKKEVNFINTKGFYNEVNNNNMRRIK